MLDQIPKVGERRKSRRLFVIPVRRCLTGGVSHQIPLMLIVMTVETQQLPVAAVRGIVVMVVVLVVDCELVELLAFKFTSAVSTDPGKYF